MWSFLVVLLLLFMECQADLTDENETQLIEKLLEDFKNSNKTENFDKRKNVAKTLAYQTATKYGTLLDRNHRCNN
jgi:galactose-1-phosphate uridylyltransferase